MREPTAEVAGFGYHEVTDDPGTSGFQRAAARSYKLGQQVFAQHLDRIGMGPCAPGLVLDVDLDRPGQHLLLTFDDGGKSALSASEELVRRGWKAHFFVITDRIGRRNFLTASEVRHIRDCGHLVGSHSHTHPDIMRNLTVARLLEEWRLSSQMLEDLLGEPCLMASVPGGDLSRMVVETAAATGFRYLFTSEPRLMPERVSDCWVLGRFLPVAETSLDQVQKLASFEGWTGALRIRHAKVLVRRVLSPLYRLYVWQRTRETDAQ